MKQFGGRVLFLDRSDINTDEVIPAKYLTEVEKDALKPHLLEDLKLKGFDPSGADVAEARVIVTRENFGCGSSREHAPWALEVNDITVVVAQGFARIFRQNMFNCGMLAIALPRGDIDTIFGLHGRAPVGCGVDLDGRTLTFTPAGAAPVSLPFELGGFDEALVRAGGWVEYADARY
ncbi:MAG: 3-isopropylmalate dehydratase small subunit [Chitinivibrionales bacterium]|nr:3-isopropylmalate dehydratase small subunit [Chitinivibrionales bacterium]MBD3396571.1 3-isopropylmalate dehydratase small subunit [Chitinivibrionales bacterium]